MTMVLCYFEIISYLSNYMHFSNIFKMLNKEINQSSELWSSLAPIVIYMHILIKFNNFKSL